MAGTLFPKRNLLAHGHLMTEITPAKLTTSGKAEAKLIAIGRLNGREVQEKFTADELDDLYYELAHLLGKIVAVSTGHRRERGMSSQDISLLRAFLATNHPTFPNLPMQRSPLAPSRQK